jgi:alkene monooxygenase reductase
VYLRYGCKNGGCGTCKSRLVEGDVDSLASSMALAPGEHDEGWILPCTSVPEGDCVLDVSAMGLTEEELLAGDPSGVFMTELERNERLTPDIRAVRLRLVEPETIRFVAGQFVNVEIPGTSDTRSYSFANPPSADRHIDLIIKVLPGGRFSSLLEDGLRPGARLRVTGPFGQMRVRLSHRPMLMIAGGSGLAPMLSMLADLAAKANTRPLKLFFGVRTADDLFGLERLGEIQRAMPVLDVIPVLSHIWPASWSGQTGMVTDAVARLVPTAADHDAYICGPPPCIDAAFPLLLRRGVRQRNIYVDVFTSAVR